MLRFLCYCCVVLLALSGRAAVSAQADGVMTDKSNLLTASVVFSRLSMDDGLSSNTVRALLQDRRGFIWMGTSRGLNRYDGHRIVPLRSTRSLSVTALAEWGDTLWVGTDNGLFLYSQRTDSVWECAEWSGKKSDAGMNVSDLKVDAGKGCLWVATMGRGLCCVEPQRKVCRAVPTPENDQSYGCVYVDRKGVVWAASNWGKANLVRYDERKKRFEAVRLNDQETLNNSGNPSSPGGIALAEDAEGYLWLGAWDGSLIRFDGVDGRVVQRLTPEETGMQHVHSLLERERGYLLVGSDKGLAVVDVKNCRARLHMREHLLAASLSDNFVYPLMLDREGGTWVGTYYGGVNYTHPVSGNFTSYTHSRQENSVSGNVVNHFCEDEARRLWIASDDGGLCRYDAATGLFEKVSLPATEGTERNVHALSLDGQRLYVGTYAQGLYVVDVNTGVATHVPQFVDEQGRAFDATSYAICTDRQHRVWVGTFDAVALYHPETRTFSDVKRVGGPVTAMRQDHTGRLWVATEGNGLWAMDALGQWRHYEDFGGRHHRGSGQVTAYSVYEDGQGNVWVGMADGLFRYDRQGDRFDAVQLTGGAVSVMGITAVEGHLWLTTSAGILCYSLTKWEVVQVYKGGGSIASTDFLPDAILRGYDGRVYLGTTNGFVAFKPQFMHRNEVKPRVTFTELEVMGRAVAAGSDLLPVRLPYMEELRLSYRESMFRVYFSAMSYLQPSDVQYSYYLEGFDEDWLEAGNHHSVSYTNLSPGTYTLHVRATTNDGMQSEDETLRIVITPPFYWNTPAKILYVLLIVAAIVFFVRHLLRKKERRHVAEIKELNEQKEQEIQEINVQKEQEIQELNEQKEQEVHDARIRFMTINDRDHEFLDKMETIIEQNFSNSELSVDYLASELGVSRSSLFSKIKALADVTPNEMIQVIRLKHAASMLVSGNYRVNEVCYMVGFSSPSYFAKCFQRQYGCTPAKYKG